MAVTVYWLLLTSEGKLPVLGNTSRVISAFKKFYLLKNQFLCRPTSDKERHE